MLVGHTISLKLIMYDVKYKICILSYRKKKLDYDNLVGGCKGLIDALIDEEFIFDDSPDYIDLHVEQHITNRYLTIITRR